MPAESDYERGAIDGRVEARLEDHGSRLDRIEGGLEKVGQDINGLVLATRHLEEAAKAEKETVKATAKALAEAESARRQNSDARWTPFQRLIASIGGASALAGWVYLLLNH